MDRRHRAVLSLAGGWMLFALAGTLSAQQTATPAASATPWVQASPPPGLAAPTPAPRPVETVPPPKPPKPPKAPKPPKEIPVPSATPTQEELTRQMMQRRAAEQGDAKPKEPVRLDQLPPDERAAYQRNLPFWRQLPADQQDALRRRADERARMELDKAYQDTGLNLDHDQREVFDLRYRQERRRLEHDLQEKANAERQRWLVEITARLKQEFADKSTPGTTVTPALTATPPPRAEKARADGHRQRGRADATGHTLARSSFTTGARRIFRNAVILSGV